MRLEDVWPLFGLEIATPRLLMRPVRDEDLPDLVRAALDGVHDPERMPFGFPWTDASPSELPQSLAAFQWALRARTSPRDWSIAFAVSVGGRVIGSQDLSAHDFTDRRTVNSGSWLTRSAQGQGYGTEMRSALLQFAFDILGAEWAESSAASWNEPSLGVSRKLGYELNGVSRVAPRPGEPTDEQRVRLARDAFTRPDWVATIRGAEPVLRQLGIGVS